MKPAFTHGALSGFTAGMAAVAVFAGAFYWMDARMERRFKEAQADRTRIEKKLDERASSIDTTEAKERLSARESAEQRPAAQLWSLPLAGELVQGTECRYEEDGQCDAVGYADSTSLCPADTDQVDCGDSEPDQCVFANDGECDAVGFTPSTDLCGPNTDKTDCQTSQLTSALCRHENDGKCDAMGNPGSTNQCPVGTDRVDCRSSDR